MDIDNTAADMDLFQEAGNLESNFYQEGYAGGFAHGRLHGLFEGRALGQEKAWEVWEEVGFYEGFAEYWLETLSGQGQVQVAGADVGAGAGGGGSGLIAGGGRGKEARAISQARQLLDMISTFPTSNPTPTSETLTSPNGSDAATSTPQPPTITTEEDPADLPRLLSSIRAKYRLLCTSVGARPRLVAAANVSADGGVEGVVGGVEGGTGQGGQVEEQEGVVLGIGGPMKGVDTRQLRF